MCELWDVLFFYAVAAFNSRTMLQGQTIYLLVRRSSWTERTSRQNADDLASWITDAFFFFPYGRSGRKRVWYYAHFSKLKAKPRRQVEHGLLLLALLYFTCYRIEQELSLVYQLLLSPTSSLHQTLPQPSLLAGYYGALGGGGHLLQDFRNPSD